MMDGVITHKQLYAWATTSFDNLRKGKYWRYHLPSDEWDDMRIRAATRVVTKAHLIDQRYCTARVRAYVGRAVDNSIKNSLRATLGDPKLNCTEHRRHVMIKRGSMAEAREMVDKDESMHPSFYIDDLVGECMTACKPRERIVFSSLLNGHRGRDLERDCVMTYQVALKQRHSIRRRFASSLYSQ